MTIPNHIAIIMDGNGRWATKQGLVRSAGHAMGVNALRKIVHKCYDIGVKTLTVYAFSTENWKRSEEEVSHILKLLMKFLKNYEKELAGRNIRIKPIGDVSKLPEDIQKELAFVAEQTKDNTELTFNVALNYGGRDEILRACNRATKPVKNEAELNEFMDAPEIDNIDLVIRTSGEYRISNFLLWQSAYAEYYFTNKMWPAFKPKDLDKAIMTYQKRNRRLGA